MARLHLAPRLVLIALLAFTLDPALTPVVAEEEAFNVPTERPGSLARGPSATGADLVAEWRGQGSAPLDRAPPPGTRAVPSGAGLFSALELPGCTLTVSFGRLDGDRAVLGVDLDGDGNLRGEQEVVTVTGRATRLGAREALRWQFPRRDLGTLRLEVAFQDVARTSQAVMILDGPTPLALSQQPPAGTAAVRTPRAVHYGVATTPAGTLTIAFVRGEGDKVTVLADVNRNGVLGDGGETFPAPVKGRDKTATFWQSPDIGFGGSVVSFAFQELASEALVTWTARATGARRGRVKVNGEDYALHLLDGDFDGTFTSAGDWWWFGPVSWLDRFTKLMTVSMVEADQPFHVGDAWRLISVDPNGNAFVMKDRSAPHPHEYFHQRTEYVNRKEWFPLFDEDTRFEEQWGIDASRSKAKTPPQWLHDVNLDEALRRAKAEKKPVLVDFEADWCSNCKRWDHHVYSDAQVAGLLSRFVLVKINVDFNFAEDLPRLGGKNPPYLVFLDAEGNGLLSLPEVDRTLKPTGRTIPGLMYFQPPADFAGTLQAAYRAWIDRRGGG